MARITERDTAVNTIRMAVVQLFRGGECGRCPGQVTRAVERSCGGREG